MCWVAKLVNSTLNRALVELDGKAHTLEIS